MGTIFVINCGSDGFYYEDNIECLSRIWSYIELFKGICSFTKIGMSDDWFKVKNEELKLFSKEQIEDLTQKKLYELWYDYFKSLDDIKCEWFCTESWYLTGMTFRQMCLLTVESKELLVSERDSEYYKKLRESCRTLI